MGQVATNFAYLATIVCFILALRFLSHPSTARRGNWIGAVGMLIAVVVTFAQNSVVSYWEIAVGMVIGGAFGAVAARRVQMTAMPQMVALFNGVGGGAAALISPAEVHNHPPGPGTLKTDISASIMLSALIVGALLFGVLFVLPIGGADMPVVISLLNAFTGLAAAATGFELENNVLIVSGMLVGASGTLLTLLMSRAMNRSITNVLFGAFGQVSGAAAAAAASDGGTVRSASAEDVAVMLAYAHKVVFVPGYGLAVAQAQHDVRQLADLLEEKGVEVSYAIHPVAGRMPGHMNVLLAEANVPYPQLKEMDEANPEFGRTDVVLVVGANDVEAAVPPERALEAVREAFVAYARGEWSMPPKVYVPAYPAGDFRAMPALGGGHALLKWVTSFPGNPARGLPTVMGLVLLSSAEDGVLRAVLDAAAVTALRTGAAAVLAAETLGRHDAASAAVVGAGANGRAVARTFLARGRDVVLWDVDAARARAAADELGVGVA